MFQYYPSFRNTYELESQPNNHKYMPVNTISNLYPNIYSERLSYSPPIILCETGNSRNKNNHSHRYLFYPSTSRLSPFSNNMNNEFNIIKKVNTNNNNYESKNEIKNKLRNENQLINKENNENSKNENDIEGRMDYNNNLGRKIVNTPQNINKYQSMFDKSLELMKTISNFIPEEDAKIKGNSSYYYNRDRDYDTIIEKQKNFLQKHFINKLGNKNQIETDIYSNSKKNNNNNLDNRPNDQFNNNFTNINDNKGINFDNHLDNINNNEIDNIGSFPGIKNMNNKDNINDDNNIRMKSEKAFDNENNENNFNNDKNNSNNKFYNKTANELNFDNDFGNKHNFGGNREISTYPNNIGNNFYDNNKGIYDNKKSNRNYINDYNNINPENNIKNEELEQKAILQMEGDNNKFDKNGFQSKNFENSNNILSKDNLNINNLDGDQKMDKNLNEINLDNDDKDLNNNNYKGNSYFNSGMSNLPTKDFFNTNNILKRNPNQISNYNQPLSQTDNNIGQKLKDNYSNQNFDFQSNLNKYYDNNLPSINNKDNNNTNKNNTNNNINTNDYMMENDNRFRNIEDKKDSESFGELLDENNKKILSEEGKPFQGELVNEKYDKDNKTFVVTKSGAHLKLSILHNREGLPLIHNGYPLLGKGENYFIDKSGKPIIYPDVNYMEGEEKVPVKIKGVKDKKELEDLNNRMNNINLIPENDNFQFSNTLGNKYFLNDNDNNPNNFYNVGFGGGMSTSQLKKSRINNNKIRHFPKGDGDAKPPLIKKKRKRRILRK